MPYQPITPLPEDLRAHVDQELHALTSVWRDRRANLESSGGLDSFVLRLRREWAIETGIIERLYAWDRGVTQVLLEQGMEAALIAHQAGLSNAKATEASALIGDHFRIVEGLFDFVKGQRHLTEHYIRTLHQEFTRNQHTTMAIDALGRTVEVELLKGKYKERPNNPRRADGSSHEYCPPDLVDDEMQRLLQWYAEYDNDVDLPVLAAWLHHRFAQVHPFQDGNGRMARALASLVFIRGGLFPLVIRNQDRTEYITALECADDGDLLPLVKLSARRQRDAILGALNVEHRVKRQAMAQQVIEAGLDALRRRTETRHRALEAVFSHADELKQVAVQRFQELADGLKPRVAPLSPAGLHYRTGASESDSVNAYWYYKQIVSTAKRLGYYANFEPYQGWAMLAINTTDAFYLVVSFHAIGHEFQGVLVASAFTFRRVQSEDGPELVGCTPATNQLFQFNYAEAPESAEERFRVWLEDCVVLGLECWRRSLATG